MDRTARFWERVAPKYARQPIADEAAYEKKVKVTQGYLNPNMNVLEIGCGTGSTAIKHAPLVKHITAVDISEKMLEIAEQRKVEAGVENIDFVQSRVDAFSVDNGSMDAVMALSVLHLMESKEDVIENVFKSLKPGGLFVTSTACLKDMNPFISMILPIGRALGFFPLVRSFSGEQLKRSLINAGFDLEYVWRPGPAKAIFIIAKKPWEPTKVLRS